jgi:hypothetical protein
MSFFTNLFKRKKELLRIRHEELSKTYCRQKEQCKAHHKKKFEHIPLIIVRDKLSFTLSQFKLKRISLEVQWHEAYNRFSWWNKLQYDERLDLSSLDEQIKNLESEFNSYTETHKEQLQKLDYHLTATLNNGIKRIEQTFNNLAVISEQHDFKLIDEDLFKKAFWFSTFSVPISIWDDFDSAANIYDALRSVNGNFEGMSDSEIWWESLFMSSESLTGLSSLAKGAYFEQLVASNTGGQLFEHFNNPKTDITIDGIEMQIKATNSIPYISSVEEDIPIITTSEIADEVRAIDGGYSNEELSNSVELALGGAVVDIKDTAIDAALTGIGGLGIFATINGINHAQERFDSGVDGVEAIFEGAGVAIEGTAKALVDASEMVYNVAMSKPSRYVGRIVLKGLKKLDDKMIQ